MDDQVFVKLSDVAQLLGVSQEAARGYIVTGKLNGVRKSKGLRQVWHVSLSDLLRFASAHSISLNSSALHRIRGQDVKEND